MAFKERKLLSSFPIDCIVVDIDEFYTFLYYISIKICVQQHLFYLFSFFPIRIGHIKTYLY